jgi:hypothetical protein
MPAHSQFAIELEKLIVAEQDRVKDIIARGGLEDFAAYREHVGQLRAYRKVLEDFYEDAHSIVDQK